MKANELMIGDWAGFNSGYGKVTGITDAGLHFEDRFGPGIASGAEPIPLTPEILEKNGFEKQGYPGWLIYTKDYMIQWRNDYPNVLSIDSFTSKYGSFKRFNVNYLHELQQALRLCGIEKEIVL